MNEHILLVEDEQALRAALEVRLKAEGYVLDTATDGEEALRKVTNHPFDLIVLDVMLPIRNGFDVCRDVRHQGMATPILMLTVPVAIDDRIKILAAALQLNDAQQAEIKKILQQRRQEMLQIRRNTGVSGSARIDQFRALQENTVQRIRAILNDEQKEKYDPLAARRIQQGTQVDLERWLAAAAK